MPYKLSMSTTSRSNFFFLSRQMRRELKAKALPQRIYLSAQEVVEIGECFDAIRRRVVDSLGDRDRKYILSVLRLQRSLEIIGRVNILLAGKRNGQRIFGASVSGLAKIIDNMEIGHNVMHGQYDMLGEPSVHSKVFEWDSLCPSQQWKITHNHHHHKYTNIEGLDRDLGYNILRVSRNQPWHPGNLGNLFYNTLLMLGFQWGVTGHIANINEFWDGTKGFKEKVIELIPIVEEWVIKGVAQLLRDHVFFPLLRPRYALKSFFAYVTANLIRDIWAYAVIFCGHFPDEVHTFTQEETANETPAEWYIRQLLGSCNIYGGKLFHFFTGNLSHQIEHHLYPDIPAYRYQEIADEVRAVCEKYNLPYNNGPFLQQIGKVWLRLAKNSLPNRFSKAPIRTQVVIERKNAIASSSYSSTSLSKKAPA